LRSYTIRVRRLRPWWPDSRKEPSGKPGAVQGLVWTEASEIPKIQTKPLSESIYKLLKEQILTNRLLPSDPLPIESLAEKLGVSATPVREALAKLGTDGLVDQIPHKTARVATITEEEVTNVYEARKLVEPYACSVLAKQVAVSFALKDRVERLKQRILAVLGQLEKSPVSSGVYGEYMPIDIEIQDLMEGWVPNHLLRRFVRLMNDHSLRVRSFTEAVFPTDRHILQEISVEHLNIIEALLDGDPKRTIREASHHLSSAQKRTIEALDRIVTVRLAERRR